MERTNRIPCHLTKLAAASNIGGFSGMASVFGTLIDSHVPTRILPGAFSKTLREDASRVKVLWQHDASDPIGRPTILRETTHGLYIEATLATTPHAQEVRTLLQNRVVEELSIGFDPVRWETVDAGERHIHELKLWEVSLVTFGANPDARVTEVHRRRLGGSLDCEIEIALLELDLLAANAGLLRGDVRR